MIGKNNSVLSRVKEANPNVYDLGCVCHLANICVQKAVKTLPLPIDELLVEVYYHFHHRYVLEVCFEIVLNIEMNHFRFS
jgi:hypothetical protein